MEEKNELIERRMVELTPELAKHYLRYNTYEGQRRVREHHVMELDQKVREGSFRYGNIAFGALKDGPDRMLDGQHLCHTVLVNNITIPCILERWKCPSNKSMAKLFRQFDPLKRSLHDYLSAKHKTGGYQWPLWITSITCSALSLDYKLTRGMAESSLKLGGGRGAVTTGRRKGSWGNEPLFTIDQKVDLIDDHLDEVLFLCDLLKDDNGIIKDKRIFKHIAISPVVMMIFKTMRIAKDDAELFWLRVIHGEGLTKADPEYFLRESLLHLAIQGNAKNASYHEYVYRIARAWNAMRTGSNAKQRYSKAEKIPELS